MKIKITTVVVVVVVVAAAAAAAAAVSFTSNNFHFLKMIHSFKYFVTVTNYPYNNVHFCKNNIRHSHGFMTIQPRF
jgi:hypothetical protein